MSGKDVSRENYDFKENYFIKFSQIHFGYYDILKILFSHLLRFPAAAIPMPRRTSAPTARKNPAKATDTLPPESKGKASLNDFELTLIEIYIFTIEKYSPTGICKTFDFLQTKFDLNAVLYFL